MTDEQIERDIVLKRVANRTAYGTILGAITGMILQPPFKGITTSPSDVQGLTYFAWFATALAGMILGAIAGLISKENRRSESKDETGSSNQAL